MVNELVLSCKQEAEKNKNDIKILSSSDIYIRGVYEEIYSAFSNLLLNALMYSGEGTSIEIDYCINNDEEIIFSIQDYGVGIPQDAVQRLTERFYRVDKGRSREQGGTGLGLSIVKHIMNRHNAKLDIESILSEGSKFSCIFPKS
jgi:two-component system phosphate regulon sensor histidine kinase PhoR